MLLPFVLVTFLQPRIAVSYADRQPVTVITLPERETRSPNPKTGGVFRSTCRVEIDEHGVSVPRFVVHVPAREHMAFAKRAGHFLGSIWQLTDKRFGTLCPRLREKTVELWLSLDGEAGGEQINNNLYVYDFLASRTELEWARELAHEYGHYLLPSPSGYTAPESWANGVLGERLFLKWLRDIGEEPVIASHKELQEYCEKQSDALIQRYEQAPPDRSQLAGIDRKAFDAFTGLMLYADAVYGGSAIMQILAYMPRSASGVIRGSDFLAGFGAWLDEASSLRIGLLASPMTVYFPKGRFQLIGDRPKLNLPPGMRLERTGNEWTMLSPSAGWRRILTDSPTPIAIKLERMP